MSHDPGPAVPVGFWHTVRVLLKASRKRAVGRQKRQQELLRHRARKATFDWSALGFIFAIFLTAVLNSLGALLVYLAVNAGERIDAENHGKVVVSYWFLREVREAEKSIVENREGKDHRLLAAKFETQYASEAQMQAREYGGSPKVLENNIRQAVLSHGSEKLLSSSDASPGLTKMDRFGSMPGMLGTIVLLWWWVMIVFQGEGLELDLQRRRHPMWEWLFSHPVKPGAVFMAEMLSPIAANPIYWTAPLFPGVLYACAYGLQLGLLAGVIIGIPMAIAAACMGKALEIACILRFAPRTRGAMIGIMSWIGYVAMMLFLVGTFTVMSMSEPIGRFLQPLAVVPWPWLGFFLGEFHGSFSFPLGVLLCWCASAFTIVAAVGFSIWGAQQGLAGNFGRADSAPSSGAGSRIQFGKDPLYRKELLWFMRDRSAIVQTILIPITVAAVQLFNLRHLLAAAQGAWNYLCGAAILFGTYFLWILGPKSLASEGPALWIALTWPRGLESLLKAKAWLWSLISSAIVAAVLLYAAWMFPVDAWKILLVGIGWYFFGRSMAEKTVTLVRVPSSSGEPEKVSRTGQWGASLGMLTFAIGILTQQWHIAIMGIVYSYITAAAMWQNFRARLPFLYDPWSEQLPPPPTLMHAMIAISILVEGGAIFTGLALAVMGRAYVAVAQAIIYGVCAVIVSGGVAYFLSERDVKFRDVWCWTDAKPSSDAAKPWWCGDGSWGGRFLLALFTGASGGVVLGAVALGYLAVMAHFPAVAELMRKSQVELAHYPGLQTSYAITAILFAPFAEEYLFRGLLFRALDREWGGWRALVGNAAFFAIYHPPLSWLPVGLLGLTNAYLFKKTGRLAPAVILHMVYNAIVLLR